MSQPLAGIFGELGISQYLDSFIDQGFDTWDTILDITESDLDALGVKLGHRRKLQRRIANFRGVAPEAALVSPTQPSNDELRQEPQQQKAEVARNDVATAIITKRKYRRHPKPDENAPERPPSAYVLFSNKMREDLKDRNLTFTEIAKLVGENWQALSAAEKEPYETQAQNAKDKYNSDMAEYKKTHKYKKYLLYLHDFRAKHAAPLHEKDGPKRVKMSDVSPGSAPHAAVGSRRARSQTTSGNGSGCSVDGGRHKDNESPLNRENRVGSTTSLPDYAAASPSSAADQSSVLMDEEMSPASGATSPRDTPSSSSMWGAVTDTQQQQQQQQPQQPQPQGAQCLPSLSNVLEGHGHPASVSGPETTNGFVTTQFQPPNTGPGSPQALVGGSCSSHGMDSRPPSLRHDCSSGASTASSAASSGFAVSSNGSGYPRTPIEGSLPIHLLLSGGGDRVANGTNKRSASPEANLSLGAMQYPQYPAHHPHHPHSNQHSPHASEPPPAQSAMLQSMNGANSMHARYSGGVAAEGSYFPAPAPGPAPTSGAPRNSNGHGPHGPNKLPHMFNGTGPAPRHHASGPHLPGLPNLDGMTALLRAGEMVDRQAR